MITASEMASPRKAPAAGAPNRPQSTALRSKMIIEGPARRVCATIYYRPIDDPEALANPAKALSPTRASSTTPPKHSAVGQGLRRHRARARHHDRLEASRGDGRRENRQGAF